MIAYLRGKLAYSSPSYVILDVRDVGYEINISLQTYSMLKGAEEVFLYTYLQIREDKHTLYGFYEVEEKELFEALISVNGVGTNTARLMLSSMNTDELKSALYSGDSARLTTIKGVGAKTADRLVLELKDKMKKIIGDGDASKENIGGGQSSGSSISESVEALVQLGLSRAQADKAVKKAYSENPNLDNSEELVKSALQYI